MARKKKEDFDVVTASQTDDGTVVITSLNELSEERMNNVIRNAVASYDPENKQYSTYLKISASSETLTVDRIDELARGLQSSLTNVQTVNGIIRNYINKDDLIGITYDAIEANVNTEFKCSFAQFPEQRNKTKQVNYAREVIDDFNTQINVRSLLRAAIPMTYAEGTYITYLRQKDENYIVDYYPLGIAEILLKLPVCMVLLRLLPQVLQTVICALMVLGRFRLTQILHMALLKLLPLLLLVVLA